MPSVRDIAKMAGVSPATVSRAINNHPAVGREVREKVISLMNEKRYVPSVGRRQITNIAFAYADDISLGSPFDAALMHGMSECMEQYKFDLMVLDLKRVLQPHETYSQMFMRKGICGAVLRTSSHSKKICELIAAEGFPSVVVGERFDNPQVNFIYADSRRSSREAVEHLINLGHRKIAVGINVVEDSDHLDRLQGYKDALAAHQRPFDSKLVLEVPARRDGGEQFIRRIEVMPDRPTAMYLTDPVAAVSAMVEAQRRGLRVPQDISIVGFDDAQLRFLTFPRMSAVCQDAREIGMAAFAALQSLIAGAKSTMRVQRVLGTQFEVHESTAVPPVSRRNDVFIAR